MAPSAHPGAKCHLDACCRPPEGLQTAWWTLGVRNITHPFLSRLRFVPTSPTGPTAAPVASSISTTCHQESGRLLVKHKLVGLMQRPRVPRALYASRWSNSRSRVAEIRIRSRLDTPQAPLGRVKRPWPRNWHDVGEDEPKI